MSTSKRCPVYLGLQGPNDERIGVLCHPFRCKPGSDSRPAPDQHRVQIRYGSEATWGHDHPLGFELGAVDTTIVLGAHVEADMFIGLGPLK